MFTVICNFLSTYLDGIEIPHMKVNILHLVAPTVYAVLYGSRMPKGFGESVRLAICCCLPVKPVEPEVEIADIVRYVTERCRFSFPFKDGGWIIQTLLKLQYT